MIPQFRSLLAFLASFSLLVIVFLINGKSKNEASASSQGASGVTKSTWYKGNLHTHSLWSDGDDFPEMIADWYKRNDYHFLALTDHNVLSDGQRWLPITEKSTRPLALKKYLARFGRSWVEQRSVKGQSQVRLKPLAEFRSLLEEPGRFLLIPGEEVTHAFAKLPVHVNAINLRDVIKPIDGGSVQETISVNHRQIAEQAKKTKRSILAFLNHPNFGWGITAEDMIAAPELRYFEVYNGHPSVRNEGDDLHPSCERMWDVVLAMRLGKLGLGPVYGVATDDAHRYHSFGVGKVNPGRGWLMVKASHLTPESIVRSMENLDFYASTGVALKSLNVTHKEINLSIQAEPGVKYVTEFIATLSDADLSSTPRQVKDNIPMKVTRKYSSDVGKVLSTSEGERAKYSITGNELYVRARITSTKPHPNPYRKGDVEMAWTQPVVVKHGK